MSAAPRPSDIAFFRSSAPFFALLMALAVVAFWPSYLYPKQVERDWHVHVHGISLFLWGAMLIVQPFLIRGGRLALHRRLGKLTYVLAPVIVVSTILLVHHRAATELTPVLLYFLWIILGLTAVFAFCWDQAIRYRRTPALHARWMIGTGLTMIDPIMARILFNHFGVEPPLLQVLTYALIDAILIALWLRDRRLGNGIRVFPTMLAVFVAVEIPTFILPQLAGWKSFAQWFAALPLP